ncbi:endonuclease/exonuclease/phosphatase family protein [Embleya sp. MST-111070]|uniref:endonuclease/exonuclease/phosphatase family protein n=1 Tax=Embleya sp. MST-111070 TaxID=3398231 RepID=UPI003F740476
MSGSSLTLVRPTAPKEGDQLTFRFATDAPHPKNWVGVYDGARVPGNGGSLVWKYVTAAEGEVTLETQGLTDGPYTAYLLAKDGYGILAQSAPFGFAARPVPPRPRFAVDTLTTSAVVAGEAAVVRLAGLWTAADGQQNGRGVTFRARGGDDWLSVGVDGTVTAKAPRAGTHHPGVLTVEGRDGATGATSQLAVQVPVRRNPRGIVLKVATLDAWDGGRHVDGALTKLLRLVLTQGLDVLALQDTGGTLGTSLAEALGWAVYEDPGGLALISRYPLADTRPEDRDLPAIAATVRAPGVRPVRVWNARLDEGDYGPLGIRRGRTPAQAEAAEWASLRYRQAQNLVTAMAPDLGASRDTPVLLAAALSSPSHLDWTVRTAGSHGTTGPVRWPVTQLLDQARLVDVFRAAHRDPAREPGNTWSPVDPAQPQDRIDALYTAGPLSADEAHILVTGWPKPIPDTAANGWPSDHAAAVATFGVRA